MDPQPNAPGGVIQDAVDGEFSVTRIELLPSGDSVVTRPRSMREAVALGLIALRMQGANPVTHSVQSLGRQSLLAPVPGDVQQSMLLSEGGCDPETAIVECGGEGWIGAGATRGTFMVYAAIIGVCDNGICDNGAGSNEFEFKSKPICGPCGGREYRTRLEGMPYLGGRDMDISIAPGTPRDYTGGIDVWIEETDVFGRDYFGQKNLNAGNTPVSGRTGYFHFGDDRCGYTAATQCNPGGPFWTEVNMIYDIRP